LILFTCVLAACLPQAKGSSNRQQNRLQNRQQKTPLFVPATPQAPPPGADSASQSGPGTGGKTPGPANQPTATAQCRDNLAFLKDVTIPDGTSVSADSTLDKRWEVENNGNCNWGKGYRIRLIAGPELGAQNEQALYPARSGTRLVVRVVFKAPLEPGSYRSAWQAFNPQGDPFGDPFFIEINVEAP
jgi:hypothetical protein